MGIKAVGFDLDGTLYPAWLMYAVSADLGIRHPRLLGAYGAARKAMRVQKATAIGDTLDASTAGSPPCREQIPSQVFKANQASFVARKLGRDPAEIAHIIDEIIYSTIERRFGLIRPFHGVEACLKALRTSGFLLGLLSDLPPARKIELLGFKGYFDIILCSEDYGSLKPDPRPFSALCAGFKLEPESILYVGNKNEYDVAGAKSVGMKTALIGRRGGAPEADFTFRDWGELTRWILAQAT